MDECLCRREPLCKFLGKELPNKPFPSGNTSKDYEAKMGGLYLRRIAEAKRNMRIVVEVLAASLIVLGAWALSSRSSMLSIYTSRFVSK